MLNGRWPQDQGSSCFQPGEGPSREGPSPWLRTFGWTFLKHYSLAVVVITLSSGQQKYCYGARTSLNWPAEWSGFWWWWELHSSRWSIPEHGDLHKICTSFTLSCLMSADSWGVLYHICIIIFILFEFENWSNSFQYEEKCRGPTPTRRQSTEFYK